MESPNPFRLANPRNVKLRESSGKAGGLPFGFMEMHIVLSRASWVKELVWLVSKTHRRVMERVNPSIER
jgi:hypothetical protein